LTGYSWKSSQYGLTIDTVTEFELVLPSGEIKVVTEKDEDLWFALKVCLNVGDEGRIMSLHTLRATGGIQQLRKYTKLITKATKLTMTLY
jgi:stalled ribosome rescue protein Dom34